MLTENNLSFEIYQVVSFGKVGVSHCEIIWQPQLMQRPATQTYS